MRKQGRGSGNRDGEGGWARRVEERIRWKDARERGEEREGKAGGVEENERRGEWGRRWAKQDGMGMDGERWRTGMQLKT